MGKKIRKYKNIVEKFLSGDNGQRFFNFAYSIGAAIVIWGALFKILHLPGGNTLLSIGMGTEVLMFILTAFDRPGRDYKWEEVFPVLDSKNPEDRPDFTSGSGIVINGGAAPAEGSEIVVTGGGGVVSGGVVSGGVVGGGVVSGGGAVGGPTIIGGGGLVNTPANVILPTDSPVEAQEKYMNQLSEMAEQMQKFKETTEALNKVSEILLGSYQAITENSENITSSSTGYVEQMQSLNRNIQGLNTIYEIQLKSVSSQLDAIDRVNKGIKDICQMYEDSSKKSARYCEESEKMALYMHQLNQVYEKMLRAMTVNMFQPMGQMPVMPNLGEETPAAENPTPEAEA